MEVYEIQDNRDMQDALDAALDKIEKDDDSSPDNPVPVCIIIKTNGMIDANGFRAADARIYLGGDSDEIADHLSQNPMRDEA